MTVILVVAAHPDDEVLGCGGSLARWVSEGAEVHALILGEGATSRADVELGFQMKRKVACLHSDAQKATNVLGLKTLVISNYPDNSFDTVPLLNVVKTIESAIDDLQPDVVLTQHGGDLNVDHVITYRATLAATRPIKGCSVRKVLAYEVLSSSEWAFNRFSPAFHPNYFVDISETLDKKIDAMKMYKSELREFPHPRSEKTMRARAEYWGSVVGCPAAEAFELVRNFE